MKRLLPLFLLLALPSAAAANLAISAETDRSAVRIDESLTLVVRVAGDTANVPEPALPNMQNFNVYSSGRSQSISIINGRITTSVSFTYVLTPRFLGLQTIPPITVTNGAETSATQPIQVNVVKADPQQAAQAAAQQAAGARAARARPSRGRAAQVSGQIMLKAETDRRTAYPGEQINLSVRFLTSTPLTSNPQYHQPVFKNLIPEDLPPVRSGETVINGERFAFSEIKTALFALTPGKAEIRPARVEVQVPSNEVLDPFDPNFFQKFMSMSGAQGETREFSTEPLTLDIKPLPPGAPAGFSGAVGSYTVSASADRQEARAGEAVNLSVAIAGPGNLKAVTAPALPDLPDFKVFDTMSSLDIKKDGDLITGRKTFTYILVPRGAGRKTVPPVTFVFFDPREARYREAKTQPVVINVQKGDGENRSVYFGGAGPAEAKVTEAASDIRYVSYKARQGFAADTAEGVTALPDWIHALPAALLAAAFWLARFNRFKLSNPGLFRFRRARGAAAGAIARAEALVKENKQAEALALLYDSYQAYLRDKCGLRTGGLTIRKASEAIKQRFPAVSPEALAEVAALWSELEQRHYAPVGAAGGAADLAARYARLADRLEKEVRGPRA